MIPPVVLAQPKLPDIPGDTPTSPPDIPGGDIEIPDKGSGIATEARLEAAGKRQQLKQIDKELRKIQGRQARIAWLKDPKNAGRLKALGASVDILLFRTESNFNELVADEKFGKARDKVERAKEEKKILASEAAALLEEIKEAESGKRVPETLATLKALREAVKRGKDKPIPAKGVPKDGDLVILNPKGIEIHINSDNPADQKVVDELLKSAHEKDLKKKPPIGLSVNQTATSRYILQDVGPITIKTEEISGGADVEEDLMYSPVDKKHQQMLRELGFLQDEATVGLNRFKHEGVEIIIQAKTGFVAGKYCFATKKAMTMFYATHVAVKSLITWGDIKDQGIDSDLFTKLEDVANKLDGDNTPLEDLLNGLDSETQKKVLAIVKEKNKDKKPPILLADIKTWGAHALYSKLKKISEKFGTGDYTTLSKLLAELKQTGDLDTRKAVLELVVKKEKMDARYRDADTNEVVKANIERLEAVYKEYQNTTLALYFKIDSDKASGAYKEILNVSIYGVEKGRIAPLKDQPEKREKLLEIARKLSVIRQKSSSEPYLKMDPNAALEPENLPKLMEAVMVFFNDHVEEIHGKKPDRATQKQQAVALLRTDSQKKDGLRYANEVEKAIRAELGLTDPNEIEDYTCLLISGKFSEVLNKKAEEAKILAERAAGPKVDKSSVVIFDALQAQDFANRHPFAAVHYAIAKEKGDNPAYVNAVITIKDIDRIIDYLFVAGTDTPAMYKPYVHYPLSDFEVVVDKKVVAPNEKAILRKFKDKVSQPVQKIFEKLLKNPANPSDPYELSNRVCLSEDEKKALDDYYASIKDDKEFADLAKIIYQVRLSFFADYDIDLEVKTKLENLKSWMKANDISSLNSEEDYLNSRSDHSAYTEGMEIIKAMVAAARSNTSIGSGITVDQEGLVGEIKMQLSRIWGTFKQTLAFSANPQNVQVGVPGGVQDDRLLILKRQYWIERGMHKDYEAKLEEAQKLKAQIDQIEAERDPLKKSELEKKKTRYDLLQTQLRTQFATLGSVDADFYAWFIEKYANEVNLTDGFVAWLNAELFDLRGIEDTHARKRMSVTELRPLLLAGKNDAKLKFSGWQLSSGLRKIDPGSAKAEQIFALFVMYVSNQSLKSGKPESVSVAGAQAGQTLEYMWSGKAPLENFGEMIRNYTLYLTQTKDPLEQMKIWNESLSAKELNKLSRQDILRFAEVFKNVAKQKGHFKKYKAVYDGLIKLAQKAPITVSSENINDDAKLLLSSFFLINLLYSGLNLEEESGFLRVVDGEGKGVEPGPDSVWKKAGRTVALFSPVPLNMFSGQWWQGGARHEAGPGNLASSFGSTFLTFGPWMGSYFGLTLPKQLVVNSYKSLRALAGAVDEKLGLDIIGKGEQTLELDVNGMPIVDENGKLQFRYVGPQELLDTALQLKIMIELFKNTAIMFYGMTGMFENLRQAAQAWDDDKGQAAWHAGVFLLKFWVANFFVMTSPDGRFLNSSFGRNLTLDRFVWRYAGKYPLKASAGVIKWMLKNIARWDSDPFLAKFRVFINEHPRFRALLDGVERLPEAGVLGSLAETQSFRRFMESWAGEWTGKGAKVALRIMNPLQWGMEGLGRRAEKGSNAAHLGNKALQGLFDLSFRLTRLDYWLYQRLTPAALRLINKQWKTRGVAIKAQIDYILRHAGLSGDLVGELNPQERVFVPGSPLEPTLGMFFNEQEQKTLDAIAKKAASADILIKLGRSRDRYQSFKLSLKAVKVDTLAARFSKDGIAIGIVKPSTLTPNAAAQIEVHITNALLHGLEEGKLLKLVERKLLELETKGIDNPALYTEADFLSFEKLTGTLRKAGIQVDPGLRGQLDGLLTEENHWKLEKVLNELGIKKITSENWPEVRNALARSLVESVDTSSERLAKMIWEGRKRLLNNQTATTYFLPKENGRIELTEAGRKELFKVIKGINEKADFVLREQIARQVEYELEMTYFANQVEATFKSKKFQAELAIRTDAELTRIMKDYYKRAGYLTFYEKAVAAAYFQECVKRSKGYTLRIGQLKAGYAGSLAGQGLQVAIDQGTGEGKTVTSPLAVFLQMLNGKKLAFVNTTTDDLSKRDWKDTRALYDLLGIENKFVARSAIDSLRIPSSGQTVLYSSFDSVRFRQLFDGLAQGKHGMVLPADKSKIFILLDEGDYLVADLRNNPAIVSSGAGQKAKDQDKVLEAERIVRIMIDDKQLNWLETKENDTVRTTTEGAKYLSLDNEANIEITKEGLEILEKYGFKSELTEYLKNALHVHRFMAKGIDYIIRFEHLIILKPEYISKDAGTGKLQHGQQYDAPMHKAMQAKIGRTKITDPGLSSIALVVPETLRPYGAVAMFSGSIWPLSSHLGKEGIVTLPNESDFPRTRIDYPAILVGNHDLHLKKTAATIVRKLIEGHPVLVHVPTISRSDADLNPEKLHKEVERQLEAIEKDTEHKLYSKQLRDAYLKFKARGGLKDPIILTDEGDFKKNEKKLAKMGQEGVVTYSDIANRGMEAKLSKHIENAASADIVKEKGFACITTQWKKSVRHFLQEIARVGRPDAAKGIRIPGTLFAIYNIHDRNFSDRAVKTFVEKTLIAGQEALVIMPSEYPTTTPKGKPGWDGLQDSLKAEAAWLLEMGALDKTQAEQYAKDGTLPPSAESAIKLIADFRLDQDRKLNESMFGENLREAESFLHQLDEELKQALESRSKSLAPIIERALLKALEVELTEAGISDTNPKWREKLAEFLQKFSKEYGIKIKLPEGIEAWQIKHELEKAIKKHFEVWNKNPQGPVAEARIAEIISKRIAQARDYLSALSAQLDHPNERVFFDFGSIEDILRSNLKGIIEREVLLAIAAGPRKIGFVSDGQIDELSGRYEKNPRFNLERIDISRGRYHYTLVTINLTKVSLATDFETELAGKLEALKAAEGFVEEGVLKIKYKGNDYDLAIEKDVKALNEALEANSSKLRIYWNNEGGRIRFIYGEAQFEDGGQYRLLRFNKEVVSFYPEGTLAFVSTEQREFLGDTPAYEIVSRPDRIAESYDKMVEAAFGTEIHGKRFALARIMFRELGLSKEQAEKAKPKLVKSATEGVEAHEKGHFANLSSGLPERTADFYLMSEGYLDSLYELMAEFHENGRLGYAIKNIRSREGILALYSSLMEELSSKDPLRRKVAEAFMDQILEDKETGRLKLPGELRDAREKMYQLLETEFKTTLDAVKRTSSKERQEAIIKDGAIGLKLKVGEVYRRAKTPPPLPAQPNAVTRPAKTPPPLPAQPNAVPRPAKTPPPLPAKYAAAAPGKFDLVTELKKAWGEKAKIDVNGAFDKIPVAQQREFVRLLAEAGFRSLIIEKYIDFSSKEHAPFFADLMEQLRTPDSAIRQALNNGNPNDPIKNEGLKIIWPLSDPAPSALVVDLKPGERGFVDIHGTYQPEIKITLGAKPAGHAALTTLSTIALSRDAYQNVSYAKMRAFDATLSRAGVTSFFVAPDVVFENAAAMEEIVARLDLNNKGTSRIAIVTKGSDGKPYLTEIPAEGITVKTKANVRRVEYRFYHAETNVLLGIFAPTKDGHLKSISGWLTKGRFTQKRFRRVQDALITAYDNLHSAIDYNTFKETLLAKIQPALTAIAEGKPHTAPTITLAHVEGAELSEAQFKKAFEEVFTKGKFKATFVRYGSGFYILGEGQEMTTETMAKLLMDLQEHMRKANGPALSCTVKSIDGYEVLKEIPDLLIRKSVIDAEGLFKDNQKTLDKTSREVKVTNERGGNVLVIADGKSKYKVFVPFEGKQGFYSLTEIEAYRKTLIDSAKGNPWTKKILGQMSPAELAQVDPKDVVKDPAKAPDVNLKKIAGAKPITIDGADYDPEVRRDAELDLLDTLKTLPEGMKVRLVSKDKIRLKGISLSAKEVTAIRQTKDKYTKILRDLVAEAKAVTRVGRELRVDEAFLEAIDKALDSKHVARDVRRAAKAGHDFVEITLEGGRKVKFNVADVHSYLMAKDALKRIEAALKKANPGMKVEKIAPRVLAMIADPDFDPANIPEEIAFSEKDFSREELMRSITHKKVVVTSADGKPIEVEISKELLKQLAEPRNSEKYKKARWAVWEALRQKSGGRGISIWNEIRLLRKEAILGRIMEEGKFLPQERLAQLEQRAKDEILSEKEAIFGRKILKDPAIQQRIQDRTNELIMAEMAEALIDKEFKAREAKSPKFRKAFNKLCESLKLRSSIDKYRLLKEAGAELEEHVKDGKEVSRFKVPSKFKAEFNAKSLEGARQRRLYLFRRALHSSYSPINGMLSGLFAGTIEAFIEAQIDGTAVTLAGVADKAVHSSLHWGIFEGKKIFLSKTLKISEGLACHLVIAYDSIVRPLVHSEPGQEAQILAVGLPSLGAFLGTSAGLGWCLKQFKVGHGAIKLVSLAGAVVASTVVGKYVQHGWEQDTLGFRTTFGAPLGDVGRALGSVLKPYTPSFYLKVAGLDLNSAGAAGVLAESMLDIGILTTLAKKAPRLLRFTGTRLFPIAGVAMDLLTSTPTAQDKTVSFEQNLYSAGQGAPIAALNGTEYSIPKKGIGARVFDKASLTEVLMSSSMFTMEVALALTDAGFWRSWEYGRGLISALSKYDIHHLSDLYELYTAAAEGNKVAKEKLQQATAAANAHFNRVSGGKYELVTKHLIPALEALSAALKAEGQIAIEQTTFVRHGKGVHKGELSFETTKLINHLIDFIHQPLDQRGKEYRKATKAKNKAFKAIRDGVEKEYGAKAERWLERKAWLIDQGVTDALSLNTLVETLNKLHGKLEKEKAKLYALGWKLRKKSHEGKVDLAAHTISIAGLNGLVGVTEILGDDHQVEKYKTTIRIDGQEYSFTTPEKPTEKQILTKIAGILARETNDRVTKIAKQQKALKTRIVEEAQIASFATVLSKEALDRYISKTGKMDLKAVQALSPRKKFYLFYRLFVVETKVAAGIKALKEEKKEFFTKYEALKANWLAERKKYTGDPPKAKITRADIAKHLREKEITHTKGSFDSSMPRQVQGMTNWIPREFPRLEQVDGKLFGQYLKTKGVDLYRGGAVVFGPGLWQHLFWRSIDVKTPAYPEIPEPPTHQRENPIPVGSQGGSGCGAAGCE